MPRHPRRPDPEVENPKIERAAAFFRETATAMNGFPPAEAQVAGAAVRMARSMPPFWDWRTRKYL